jgi:hypothetical protein
VIAVAVPRDAPLEAMDGCYAPGLDFFSRRLRDWWRRFTG